VTDTAWNLAKKRPLRGVPCDKNRV